MIAFALLLGLLSPPAELTPPVAAAPWTLDEVLSALRQVESGGHPDEGRGASGDHGAALGPYQIHRAYWQDARVPGRYEQCRDPSYSRAVVLAYWRRWCPRALESVDAEVLARVHNGGPRGAGRASTRPFWIKVERALVDRRASERRAAPLSAAKTSAPGSAPGPPSTAAA